MMPPPGYKAERPVKGSDAVYVDERHAELYGNFSQHFFGQETAFRLDVL